MVSAARGFSPSPGRNRMERRRLLVKMRGGLFISAVLAGLATVAAPAAEIEVAAPGDRSVLRGIVEFRLRPKHEPGESFLSNPEVSFQDEYGKEVHRFPTTYNQQSGLCTGSLDTRDLKDGLYLVTVRHRYLLGAQARDVEEDRVYGVRNRTLRPRRFTVEFQNRPFRTAEPCDVTVRVLDQNGRRLPAARVDFKITGAELDTTAEITDSSGEAAAMISSDEPSTATLQVSVEGLPPISRQIRFVD